MRAASSLTLPLDDTTFRRRRLALLCITWLSYATYYLGRKQFAVVKSRIHHDLGIATGWLATIDTGYLAAYALGQFASGVLGDRLGARRVVGFGMLASAAACAAFGLSSYAGAFALAFTLNGLAQSTGWPGNNKAVAAWTTPEDRGAIMGVWCTAGQVGGLAATALATFMLARLGWRAAFFGPAIALAAVGTLVLVALPVSPAERAAYTETSPRRTPSAPAAGRSAASISVARSPAIWTYGASFFCIKLIRYCILFWLPFYLHEVLRYPEHVAGYLSTSFEVGGVLGTIGFGVVTDRFRRVPRAAFAAAGLVGLALALLVYSRLSSAGAVTNFATMALVGVMLFGPDNLIAGAIGQDLGGREAASTAVGIINGVGSAGAILQGVFTVEVSRRYGWSALFVTLPALAVAAALLAILAGRLARRHHPHTR